MPTITARLLRLLAPLALAVALCALPVAAPAPARAADDVATQDADDADPSDDPAGSDDVEAADDPDDGTSGDDCDTKSLKTGQSDEADDADDADSPDEFEDPLTGDFRSCDNDAPTSSSPASFSAATALRTGKLNGGTVRITGPGEIEQTLTLTGATKAKGSRTVLGKADRKVTKAGKVRMTIILTKAGKAKLKRAKGSIRATMTTKVKVRGAKARTTTRKITLKGA